MLVSDAIEANTHQPMPKSWQMASGCKIEMLGGYCGRIGQWLRMPTDHFDQVVRMPNGETYRLVRNYPGYKYEWVYVLEDNLQSGEIVAKHAKRR